MKSLIVIGGAAPETLPALGKHSKTIAADSGYDTALRLGLVPDIFVGDGDSTERRAELEKKGISFAPVAKDDTDFTLAIKHAEDEYDLIGGGEGRLDHTLGIFSSFITAGEPKIWLTREDALWSGKSFRLELPANTLISFFPVNLMKSALVSTEGLEWNLTEKAVDLSFFSLSNRTVGKTVTIESSEPLFIRLPLQTCMGEYSIEVC